MWHRLGRQDFRETGELMGGSSGTRVWRVCERYELRELPEAPEGGALTDFLVPAYSSGPPNFDRWREYEPLRDTPDLFLKFAKVYQAEDQVKSMTAWVHSYGVLGDGYPSWQSGAPQHAGRFREAVAQAAGVLALYEAVLNGDDRRAKSVVLEEFPFVGIWWRIHNALPDKPAHMDREFVAAQIVDSVEEIHGGDYLRYALETAADEVEHMVNNYCSPALSVEEGARDPSGVTAQWNFKSLLGAMYLEMYWLMAAGTDLARCEYCGFPLSLARPNPEGRKRRSDKRFCDDACRQAQHRSKKKA